ncbi:MAG: GIY-YIG nuclease family protein [Marivibrio sp.]|uniref:GIY-YIG nuclease family protein n=1 Tax=Marivibrio sp. TaxID=2039719 RepID=UPI0032EAB875
MAYAYVYILASRPNGVLYVGVTHDLVKRVWEHKEKVVGGFTQRYGVDTLVWFEAHEEIALAIRREKSIKRWRRSWKIAMIERENPGWRDLYVDIIQ